MKRSSQESPDENILFNRSFSLLMQGTWIGQLGTQTAYIATIYWLRQTTDSASLIGLLATSAAIPLLVLSPIGGIFADRWKRLKILIICDLICCLSCLLLMFISNNDILYRSIVIPGIFLGNLLIASCAGFTGPSLNALIPDVVHPRQLEKAIGYSQASNLIAIICGQALGALLLSHYPPPVLFGINAVTYIISALAESLVRPTTSLITGVKVSATASLWNSLHDAVDYVWRRPGMRMLLIATIPVSMFSEPILVFLPFYTTDALGMSLSYYAYLASAFSIGLLAGYILSARSKISPSRRSLIVIGSVIVNAAICLVLSVAHAYWLALLSILAFGCCSGSVALLSLNALTAQTEPNKRGRVAAILVMITQGLTPLAMAPFGMVGDLLHGNLRPIYATCGLVLIMIGVALLSSRDLHYFFCNSPAATN